MIASQSVAGYPLDTDNGRIHQFNVTMERQFKDIGLRVSYQGMRARGINYTLELDKPQPSLIAFTQARRGENAELWGRTVRTARWRYTEWNEGKDGVELYDHDVDPHENANLASNPLHATTTNDLRAHLAETLGPK